MMNLVLIYYLCVFCGDNFTNFYLKLLYMERYNNYSLDELEAELYIFSTYMKDMNDTEAIKTILYLKKLLNLF